MRSNRGVTVTDYRFTGQRADGYIKLIDMGARRYDPALGLFISADTIIPDPGNPLDLNRYSYVRFNPLKYVDPSGHDPEFPMIDGLCGAIGICKAPLIHEEEEPTKKTKAEVIWEEFEGECEYNCANFASTVLSKTGLTIDKTDPPPYWWLDPECKGENWVNSAYIFKYLTEELGFRAYQLPYHPYEDINPPENSLVFYNNDSYHPEDIEEPYNFNHVAVVVGKEYDPLGYLVPSVLDVDNVFIEGIHRYNHTKSYGQIIWVVINVIDQSRWQSIE